MWRLSSTSLACRTSASLTEIAPLSGSTRRLKHRSSVVLPDPLSPTSATHSPSATSIDTPASASTGPAGVAYRFITSRAVRDTSVRSAGGFRRLEYATAWELGSKGTESLAFLQLGETEISKANDSDRFDPPLDALPIPQPRFPIPEDRATLRGQGVSTRQVKNRPVFPSRRPEWTNVN